MVLIWLLFYLGISNSGSDFSAHHQEASQQNLYQHFWLAIFINLAKLEGPSLYMKPRIVLTVQYAQARNPILKGGCHSSIHPSIHLHCEVFIAEFYFILFLCLTYCWNLCNRYNLFRILVNFFVCIICCWNLHNSL